MELIAGYILAAGRSSRLPEKHKGLQLLQHKPLMSHVIERFAPQVDHLHINSHLADYARFNYPLISDQGRLFDGPLNGLLSCMQHSIKHYPKVKWIAIAPCDAPFLPHDMVAQLYNSPTKALARCCATSAFIKSETIKSNTPHNEIKLSLQPTFSLWNVQLISALNEAVSVKQFGGFKAFIDSLKNLNQNLFYALDWSQRNSTIHLAHSTEESSTDSPSNAAKDNLKTNLRIDSRTNSKTNVRTSHEEQNAPPFFNINTTTDLREAQLIANKLAKQS